MGRGPNERARSGGTALDSAMIVRGAERGHKGDGESDGTRSMRGLDLHVTEWIGHGDRQSLRAVVRCSP